MILCIDWSAFFTQFWPGLASTFIGAVLAILSTIRINRNTEKKQTKKKEQENKNTLRDCFTMFKDAMQNDCATLTDYIQALTVVNNNDQSQGEVNNHKPQNRINLDTSIWDVLKTDMIKLSDNRTLKTLISSYYLRISQLLRTHKEYHSLFYGFVGVYSDTSHDKYWFSDYLKKESNELMVECNTLINLINAEIVLLS